MRSVGESIVDGLGGRFAAGERAGWEATGGQPFGEASPSGDAPAAASRAPGWARQMRGEQLARQAQNLARDGEGGGRRHETEPAEDNE